MNEKLLKELKTILKEEYEIDLPDADVEKLGNYLVNCFQTLLKQEGEL